LKKLKNLFGTKNFKRQKNQRMDTLILENDPKYKENLLNSLMSKFKFTTLEPIERKKKVNHSYF
jgi:hypothetical protein